MWGYLQVLTFAGVVFVGWAVSMQRLAPSARPSFSVELENIEDVVYVLKMTLGDSVMDIIPDTGSFEAVIFSDDCEGCGDKEHLYHGNRSQTLTNGDLITEQFYGSGSVKSLEAYDNLEIGGKVIEQQMFWKVFEANMPVLESSMISGILGLGSPTANIKMAKKTVDEVEKQIDEMKKNGVNVSQYLPLVEAFKKKANFTETEQLWVMGSEMKAFSICFGKEPGSNGILTFNDGDRLSDGFFKKEVVIDDGTYWSANLTTVTLAPVHSDVNLNGTSIGCEQGCLAILDSGTSLLALPQDAYDKVSNMVLSFFDNISDGCSNLEGLPDLEFSFGGEHFSLPPEAYVGEVSDDYPDELLKHMPHLDKFRQYHGNRLWTTPSATNDTFCSPIIMSMGDEPMWILGMPFFRKYNTMFHLTNNSLDYRKCHFAEAADLGGDHCIEGTPDDSSPDTQLDSGKRVGPFRVNGHKVIPPGVRTTNIGKLRI